MKDMRRVRLLRGDVAAASVNTGFPPYLVTVPLAIYSRPPRPETPPRLGRALLACAAAAPASPLMWEIRGAEGLRMCDTSAIPQLTTVNPNITVMLMGEEA